MIIYLAVIQLIILVLDIVGILNLPGILLLAPSYMLIALIVYMAVLTIQGKDPNKFKQNLSTKIRKFFKGII